MKSPKVQEERKAFVRSVDHALRRAANVARKTARLHHTPIYIWKDGKVVVVKNP